MSDKNIQNESSEEIKLDEVVNESIYVPDSFDDEFDTGSSLIGAKYDLPEDASTLIDTADGKVVDKKDLKPFDIIKVIAKENNLEVLDPSPGCHHCYGRGYEGIEVSTQMPIPCRCIYPRRTPEEKSREDYQDLKHVFANKKVNHNTRRQMMIAMKNRIRHIHRVQKRAVEVKEIKENDNRFINKFVKEYIALNSIKKTAKLFELTETQTKKLIKSNKEKIQKARKKLVNTKKKGHE